MHHYKTRIDLFVYNGKYFTVYSKKINYDLLHMILYDLLMIVL